ncbi:MAG: excinuclease ABC subunit UvrC [Oscillospiraceae bacterium]|nr:excinuclease ABC subunit UvrC [Oscillospiraceae bacterium]
MNIEQLKEKALALPLLPGVYIMMDKNGDVIYVGKAKALKNRVVSYFREGPHSSKTAMMVSKVDSFDVIMVRSEFEALITENQLIKLHKPKYNILLKDDKGYPYLRINRREEYPKMKVVGRPGKDGADYLGPYGSRTTVFEAVNAVSSALKLPTCSRRFPADIGRFRPCIDRDMGLCAGWCTGSPDAEEYRRTVEKAVMIFEGRTVELEEELTREMELAAENLEFERAAAVRDRLRAVKTLAEKQLAVSGALADTDAIGFARSGVKSCFVVLHYIGGKLLDKDTELMDDPLEDDAEAVSSLMRQYYLKRGVCPEKILLPVKPDDSDDIERMLRELFNSKTVLTAPQRGDKRILVQTAVMNASEEIKRATDREERISGVLKWLQTAAALPELPARIEAYDISNLGNEDAVGSMTVFTDARPLKRDYRKFKIKTVEGADDYASMREVITRRLTSWAEGDEKFSVLPDLFLIDGGSIHARTAAEVVESFSLSIPVLGMVKDDRHRTRALALPDGGEIGIVSNPAVFAFIGRIQEETHRFAIEYQRSLRDKKLGSSLDAINGVGPVRRNALLRHFKTVSAIARADTEQLSKVVPKNTAAIIFEHFHPSEKTDLKEAEDK